MNFNFKPFRKVSAKILTLLLRGLIICALFGSPIAAHAGVFSFVESVFAGDSVTQASAYQVPVPEGVNTQNMSLLKAAAHFDPNPTKGKTSPTIVSNTALLAFVGPTGTIADIEGIESHHIHVYEVQEGDTLSQIAAMFDVSVETVAWTNNLKVTSQLREGQNLVILPVSGILHTVSKGETLSGLAEKFDVSIDDLVAYNAEIRPDSELMIGDELIIPEKADEESSADLQNETPKKSPSGALIASSKVPEYYGYYIRPVVEGVRTQGLHGYNAVDLAGKEGTQILAAAAGKVLVAASSGWNYGYGNYVVISHDNGTQTLYAHLNKVYVSPGDTVEQSETIGTMGSTGRSTGPHVHFEIRGAKNPF
jgi:murein DD-endopeptidase MepM/ murein hydrolase activator NlpD